MKKIPLFLLPLLLLPGLALAASQVAFDPASREFRVSGACTGREVLVLFKTDGKIFASSNPPCAAGEFEYRQKISVQTDPSAVVVETSDGGYAANKNTRPEKAGMNSVPLLTMPDTAAQTFLGPDVPAEAPPSPEPTAWEKFLNDLGAFAGEAWSGVQEFASLMVQNLKAAVLAAEKIFTRELTLAPQGRIALPAGANEISGRAVLLAGTRSVFIPHTGVAPESLILITPNALSDAPLSVIAKDAGRGFEVGILRPQNRDVPFDWTLFQSYIAGAPSESLPGSLLSGEPAADVSPVAAEPVPAATPAAEPTVSPEPTPTPAPADAATDALPEPPPAPSPPPEAAPPAPSPAETPDASLPAPPVENPEPNP